MTSAIRRLTLTALALLFLFPASAMGADREEYARRVSQIDRRIEQVLVKRKANARAQQEQEAWTKQAGAWIDQYNRLNQEMIHARQRAGDYATMADGQLNDTMASLQQELANVITPPGGRRVGGQVYADLNALQADMVNRSEYVRTLQTQDEGYTRELVALDAERDKIANQAINMLDIARNQKLQKALEDIYYRKKAMAVSPDFWCERVSLGRNSGNVGDAPVVCQDRKMALISLAERYRNYLITENKQFNQQELAQIVRNAQDRSNRIKQAIIDEELPSLEQAMQTLRAEEAGPANVQLAGCWLLHEPGGSEHAVLNITEVRSGQYRAALTNPGWLDYPPGHVLFTVRRVNATTFEGNEHSFEDDRPVDTRLRIIVDYDRSGADYRTQHDMVTLAPCGVGM